MFTQKPVCKCTVVFWITVKMQFSSHRFFPGMSLLWNTLGDKEVWLGVTQPGEFWRWTQFCPGLGFLLIAWLRHPAPPQHLAPRPPPTPLQGTCPPMASSGLRLSRPPSLWGSFGGLLCYQPLLLCLSPIQTLRGRGLTGHFQSRQLPWGDVPALVQSTRSGHLIHSRKTGQGNPSEVAGLGQMSWCFWKESLQVGVT